MRCQGTLIQNEERNKKQLTQFNQTGVWPGSQKMAGGGFLGPSMGASVSAVETTYQSNKTATLMEDGNRYGYNTQQVLTDVQNGDALNVFVKNMPDSWGNGSDNNGGFQFPFDLGIPDPFESFPGTLKYSMPELFKPKVDAESKVKIDEDTGKKFTDDLRRAFDEFRRKFDWDRRGVDDEKKSTDDGKKKTDEDTKKVDEDTKRKGIDAENKYESEWKNARSIFFSCR